MSDWIKFKDMSEFSANFLWPHDDESIEEAGYEFANAKTEEYQKEWWDILIERAKAQKKDSANLKHKCGRCGTLHEIWEDERRCCTY